MTDTPDDIGEFFTKFMDTFDKKEVFRAAFEGAQLAALWIDKSCRQHFKKKGRKGRGGGAGLAGSFEAVPAIRRSRGVVAGAYSPLPYAGIRQTGGTIYPNKKKSLSVPLTDQASAVGSPLNWKGAEELVFIPAPPGSKPGVKGLLGLRKRDKYIPQYALRASVRQEGSGYLTWAENKVAPQIQNLVGKSVVKTMLRVKVPKAPGGR